MRTINCIILHHSLTSDGATLSWDDIVRYHTAAPPHGHGWSGVGYHLGVERVEHALVTLLGRPWTEAGAHAVGRNHDSIGLCVVGDYDLAPPPPDVWQHTLRLVRWMLEYHHLSHEAVLGHREVQTGRQCPGIHFDMDTFRQDLSI